MNKKLSIMVLLAAAVFSITSCYNNKKDIETLPTVSFEKEVVPIVTSGPCGCHNNGANARAVQFSNLYKLGHGVDTIQYDAILARVSLFNTWVNGGSHPGSGAITLTPNENRTIKDWINQGAIDDRQTAAVTGPVTYTANIAPMVATTCSASSCHGGLAVVLNYAKLVSKQTTLQAMIASKGQSSHPGGTLSLSTGTWSLLNAWIQQGMPQ